jgi:hypothetical protein
MTTSLEAKAGRRANGDVLWTDNGIVARVPGGQVADHTKARGVVVVAGARVVGDDEKNVGWAVWWDRRDGKGAHTQCGQKQPRDSFCLLADQVFAPFREGSLDWTVIQPGHVGALLPVGLSRAEHNKELRWQRGLSPCPGSEDCLII